jgi:hypothetical protein
MNNVKISIGRDTEAERSEFAWHPQWVWIQQELKKFSDDLKDKAAYEEERHLYVKGQWHGAELLIRHIESLLERYKKEDEGNE